MSSGDPAELMHPAWLQAAAELEIRITAPYVIPSDLGPAEYVAFLPDFGGDRGMVVSPARQDDRVQRFAAREQGLYFSRLSDNYLTFNRDLFIDTLNDWGWYGPEEARPDWYTGQAWA
jgi:hypothetical protein